MAWEDVGNKSRALYNVNQKTSGGASTKEHPLDFRFHQRQLSKAESARVWDWLRRNLNDEEFALIERYLPKQSAPAVSTWERLKGMSWIFGRL